MAMGVGAARGGQWVTDVIANLGGAAVTAFTTMNFGTGATSGSYVCKFTGLLQKIRFFLSAQAATSLAENAFVTLNCNKWQIQTHTFALNGFGLQTVSSAPPPIPVQDYPPAGDAYLNLPVEPALTILPQVQYAYSPVTPYLAIVGMFQITKGPG